MGWGKKQPAQHLEKRVVAQRRARGGVSPAEHCGGGVSRPKQFARRVKRAVRVCPAVSVANQRPGFGAGQARVTVRGGGLPASISVGADSLPPGRMISAGVWQAEFQVMEYCRSGCGSAGAVLSSNPGQPAQVCGGTWPGVRLAPSGLMGLRH